MHTADTDYLYDCGSFKSRYYPDNYPINYVHTWYLDTRSTGIKVRFEPFDTELFDVVEVEALCIAVQ